MLLEISNNSSSIMRSCQKKYYWTYIKGLKPKKKSTALTLGGVLHAAFDMHYNKFSASEVLQYIKFIMDEQISKNQDMAEDLLLAKYILIGMWTNYPLNLDDFVNIEPEKEFRVNVPNTRGLVFVGKIDGLITDKSGKIWVRELKTTSQTFQQFESKVRQSPQGTGYIWACRQMGIPVQGVIYDYVKKPLLRRGVSETIDGFGQRIISDYATRPDMYYKRHFSYRIEEELRLFEEDLKQVSKDIRTRSKDGKWYRNPDQCWNYNQECPFLRICFKENPSEFVVEANYDQKATKDKGGNEKDGGSAEV